MEVIVVRIPWSKVINNAGDESSNPAAQLLEIIPSPGVLARRQRSGTLRGSGRVDL